MKKKIRNMLLGIETMLVLVIADTAAYRVMH